MVEVGGLLLGRGSRRLCLFRGVGPFGFSLRFWGIDGDMLSLRYIIRIRSVGVGEVVVEDTVRFAIQASNTSRLLLPVCPHVRIIVVLVSSWALLLSSRLYTFLEELLIRVLPPTRHHTPSTQSCGPCRSTQRCAIRALTPQHRRFIVVPITLLEFEATVLCPEEEPYSAEDESNADERKESKEATIIDMVRINGAETGVVFRARWSRDVSCSKVCICLERGESVGAFDERRRVGGGRVRAGEESGNIGSDWGHGW